MSYVDAVNIDDAYELASRGLDRDFEENNYGDSWRMYMIRCEETGEEKECE